MKERKSTLKVYYAYYNTGLNNTYPVIRIGGKYLHDFGFEIGCIVEIILSKNQIIVKKR